MKLAKYIANITFGALLAATAITHTSAMAQQDRIKLPEMGDTMSGLFSPAKEKLLGDMWLRMFRAQAPTLTDPLVYQYTQDQIAKLAVHSELTDKNIELVIVNDTSINAFAVPGGVMGINAGLFLQAQTEAEFSAVVGHELAHLSQRHFVRSLEKQKQQSIPMMAAMLASILLAATVDGQAGMAGMMASQAAALENQLRFSRSNEQEADRIGIRTLAAAGYDPTAQGDMFDRMHRATRYYGKRPPEYLMSHPLTEKRISDARLRARSMPASEHRDSQTYQLMRARVQFLTEKNQGMAVQRFKAEIDGDGEHKTALKYGLALAYIGVRDFQRSQNLLDELIAAAPGLAIFQHAQAQLYAEQERYQESNSVIDKTLADDSLNLAFSVLKAENLMAMGKFSTSKTILERQVRYHPKNEHLWYLIAEVSGLEGNILDVHKARAEYFLLLGALDQAIKHQRLALKLVDDNYIERARIQARLESTMQMMRDLKEL